ncbi:MAG TPA: energy transducer TonB [Candidatus Edwardsbacteria bacterium]|nr:energy transducer TonB [Candidatus Edwardsbacteria bacterium]
MFTTNFTLLIPAVGVAAGLAAAMLVVRSHDLRLASIGFTGKSSRLLVPHHTAEGVLLAVSAPLVLMIMGSCGMALREYYRPPAKLDTGGYIVIPYDRLMPPPPIDDHNNTTDPGRVFAKTPTGVGIPKPVPQDSSVDPQGPEVNGNWLPGGTALPGQRPGDSVVVTRDDTPPRSGPVELQKFPELVKRIDPVYPSIAVKIGCQGRVYIQALLDIDGRVLRAEVQRSSGYPALDEAALDAVRQWVFTPAIAPDGRPTKVWQMCPIVFRIAN